MVPFLFCVFLPLGATALHVQPSGTSGSWPHYADQSQQTILVSGTLAVRSKMRDPQYDDFRDSFVQISSGNLSTFCGTVEMPLANNGDVATRFLSFSGRQSDTTLEFRDPDFAVLWQRLCDRTQGGW